jgi:hypothetical protein
MAEYKDYGPGWNATGRAVGNVTLVMNEDRYEPYSSPEKVFQYPFEGRFGNVKWIDRPRLDLLSLVSKYFGQEALFVALGFAFSCWSPDGTINHGRDVFIMKCPTQPDNP